MQGNGQPLYFELDSVDGVHIVELTPNREISRREYARRAAFMVPCPECHAPAWARCVKGTQRTERSQVHEKRVAATGRVRFVSPNNSPKAR
jgi:hypothetical protein